MKLKPQPKVSVLLNCYNEEKGISKAITSVLSQTFKNYEFIIWDDGSTDKTLKIIREFKDKRIKVYKNKINLGLGQSRVRAQKKIKGKYVAIIDADDFFHKNKIKEQVNVLDTMPNVGLVTTWAKLLSKKKNIRKDHSIKLSNKAAKKRLLYYNFLTHPSIMYRKKLAKKTGWYSKRLKYSQDYDLTLKILEKSDLYIIRKYLTFAQHDGSSMSFRMKNVALKERNIILKNNIKKRNLSFFQKIYIKVKCDVNIFKILLLEPKNNLFKIFLNIFLKPYLLLEILRLKIIKRI
jgi:glycosyltransferase involved in cell wall biosynthesis